MTQQVMMIGDTTLAPYHPADGILPVLREALAPEAEWTLVTNYRDNTLPSMENTDLLVICADWWDGQISDANARMISGFLLEGGRVLVLHSGISLAAHPDLFALFGARFDGHPPFQKLALGADPGMDTPEWEMEEEPYRYVFCGSTQVEYFLYYRQDGQVWPAGWHVRAGAGLLTCLMPGHTPLQMAHPEVIRVMKSVL